MTKEKKLHLLICRMMEYLGKQIETLPEEGEFYPNYVVIDYPDTSYEGFLRYEHDQTDASGKRRRIRTSMRPAGSDWIVSHFVFCGTKQQCLAWLSDPKTEELLKEDYAELAESVKNRE